MSGHSGTQGQRHYFLDILSLKEQRNCPLVLHHIGLVILPAHVELLQFRQRWARGVSEPVPQESILTKKRQFLQLLSVVSYVLSGHLLCSSRTWLVFCLSVIGNY